MTYVYVLHNPGWKNQFYVGVTNNIDKRVRKHNTNNTASTRGGTWKLVYYEAYQSRSYALTRERTLKKNRRVWRHVRERILESLK